MARFGPSTCMFGGRRMRRGPAAKPDANTRDANTNGDSKPLTFSLSDAEPWTDAEWDSYTALADAYPNSNAHARRAKSHARTLRRRRT